MDEKILNYFNKQFNSLRSLEEQNIGETGEIYSKMVERDKDGANIQKMGKGYTDLVKGYESIVKDLLKGGAPKVKTIEDVKDFLTPRKSPYGDGFVEKADPIGNYLCSKIPVATKWNVFKPYSLYPPEAVIGFISPVGIIDFITDAFFPEIGGIAEEFISGAKGPVTDLYNGYDPTFLINRGARERGWSRHVGLMRAMESGYDNVIGGYKNKIIEGECDVCDDVTGEVKYKGKVYDSKIDAINDQILKNPELSKNLGPNTKGSGVIGRGG